MLAPSRRQHNAHRRCPPKRQMSMQTCTMNLRACQSRLHSVTISPNAYRVESTWSPSRAKQTNQDVCQPCFLRILVNPVSPQPKTKPRRKEPSYVPNNHISPIVQSCNLDSNLHRHSPVLNINATNPYPHSLHDLSLSYQGPIIMYIRFYTFFFS